MTSMRLFWQVNEIAFINTLEAQNKKIEVMTRHQVRHISNSSNYYGNSR